MWRKWDLDSFLIKFSSLSKKENTIVIMRHSEREEILSPESSHKALLTVQGKANARMLGSKLPLNKQIRFFHSPVERCKQTVDNIILDMPESSYDNGGTHRFSGCPYIRDGKRFNELIFKYGGIEFIKKWISGNIDTSVMDPWNKSIVYMLSGLIDVHKQGNGGIDIHVTHDMNILLLMNLLNDLTQTDFEWPYYLEGFIVYYKGDCVSVVFRDIEKRDIMRGLVSV